MNGCGWKVLVVACCFAVSIPSATVFAQEDAPGAELLRRLPASPDPTRTMTFTYEFTEIASKEKGTEEQIAARLAVLRAQIDQAHAHMEAVERQAATDRVMAHFEAAMRQGSTYTNQGQAEVAPGFRAVAQKDADDEGARWNWTIQRGDKLSELRASDRSAHPSHLPLGRTTSLSRFMDTVGLCGKLPPAIEAEVRASKSVKRDGGKFTVEIDHGAVVFTETPAAQLVLESFRTGPDWITVTFEDYRTFGGVLVPTRVTRDASLSEVDIRSVYRVESVEVDGELTIPFKAAGFGEE